MTYKSKRLNLRFKNPSDVDLIKHAAAKNGLTTAEWSRRAALKVAEEQVHHSGISVVTLKNLFLIRRMLEFANLITPEEIATSKEWAIAQTQEAIGFEDVTMSGGRSL